VLILDGEAADHAVGHKPVDSALHGRGRQPDDRTDVAVPRAGVLPEEVEDAAIEVVHPTSVRGEIARTTVATRVPCAIAHETSIRAVEH
jgi:hypothetical protein